ncbi:MAG: hypothetical protein NC299_04035 [Lachnospiraceae bacterium]|nr:hypothetical protein [Ruminococcus sp.]MCM1274517.1 hypothetical protein [Lachnospiraceae bacterium]
MGFIDFISTVGSAIRSAISSVCDAIGGALTKIGEAAKNFVSVIAEKLPIDFPGTKLPIIIQAIGGIIGAIAEVLGLKKPKEDEPEDMGMKAEAADKKPDNFDSTQAYIEYLQKDVKIDEDKKKKLTAEEKAAYTSIGSQIYLQGAEEKMGVPQGTLTPEAMLDYVKLKTDSKEIIEHAKQLSAEGLNTKDLSDYLHNNSESLEKSGKVVSALEKSFKELDPDISDEDIADRISQMHDTVGEKAVL